MSAPLTSNELASAAMPLQKNVTMMNMKNMKTSVYAFSFDKKGLMAGVGLQGTKINKINK